MGRFEERRQDHEGRDDDHQCENDTRVGDDPGGDGCEDGGQNEENRSEHCAKHPACTVADGVAIGGDPVHHAVEAFVDSGFITGGRQGKNTRSDCLWDVRNDPVDNFKVFPTLSEDSNQRYFQSECECAAKSHRAQLRDNTYAKNDEKEHRANAKHVSDLPGSLHKTGFSDGIDCVIDLLKDVCDDSHSVTANVEELRFQAIGLAS